MANSSLSSYKSTIESTGADLSKGFYLNKYYSKNHSAISGSSRRDFQNCELIYEDSRALSRASKHLSKYKYSEDEIEENIYSSILAFQDTYNNALDSGSAMDDKKVKKYVKQLENMIGEREDELADIGITFDSKTKKMSVSESILKNIDIDDIKKVFSKEETDLLKRTTKLAKRINQSANEYIYAQMTGEGLKINITL